MYPFSPFSLSFIVIHRNGGAGQYEMPVSITVIYFKTDSIPYLRRNLPFIQKPWCISCQQIQRGDVCRDM